MASTPSGDSARAPQRLEPGGWLFLEHGMGKDRAVRELLSAAGKQ